MAGTWVNYGDASYAEWGGLLMRPEEGLPGVYEAFRLYIPAFDGDYYRAFRFTVDLDDFDAERRSSVLWYNGYGRLESESAEGHAARLSAELGPDEMARMLAEALWPGWSECETYHDHDDGYASAYDVELHPGARPYGAVEPDELTHWMVALGMPADLIVHEGVHERLGRMVGDGVIPEAREVEGTFVIAMDTTATANGYIGDEDHLTFSTTELARLWLEAASEHPESRREAEWRQYALLEVDLAKVMAAVRERYEWADLNDLVEMMQLDADCVREIACVDIDHLPSRQQWLATPASGSRTQARR